MNDSTIFVLIFAVGILGGIALYGRRCERRIAREARLAAAAPDELVNGETTVEEVLRVSRDERESKPEV